MCARGLWAAKRGAGYTIIQNSFFITHLKEGEKDLIYTYTYSIELINVKNGNNFKTTDISFVSLFILMNLHLILQAIFFLLSLIIPRNAKKVK